MDKEIIEFRCKTDKSTITIFGAGKFGEEKLVLDKTKASLLFIELWKFLEYDMNPIYTEEAVKSICNRLSDHAQLGPHYNGNVVIIL